MHMQLESTRVSQNFTSSFREEHPRENELSFLNKKDSRSMCLEKPKLETVPSNQGHILQSLFRYSQCRSFASRIVGIIMLLDSNT